MIQTSISKTAFANHENKIHAYENNILCFFSMHKDITFQISTRRYKNKLVEFSHLSFNSFKNLIRRH